MVTVAQLVEPRIVIPVVVGSNPIGHPISTQCLTSPASFWMVRVASLGAGSFNDSIGHDGNRQYQS